MDEPASLSEAKTPWVHGLYAKQLVLPGEDSAEFDDLRAIFRREHQPVNTTEEILVDELAQKRTGREPAPPIKSSDSADLGAGRESVVRD